MSKDELISYAKEQIKLRFNRGPGLDLVLILIDKGDLTTTEQIDEHLNG